MKQFLETNKVYFETVVAILLGIMAVVVAASQAWLAYKSYELTKLPYLPQIAANITMGGERCGEESWKLTTRNLSGSAYDVRVEPIAFLSIRELQLLRVGQEPNSNIELKTALLPLRGYFSLLSYASSATQGELVIHCTKPLKEMDSSKREFEALYASNAEKSITSHVDVYMVVSYKDRFRNSHTKYFQVSAGGMAEPISEDSGRNLSGRYSRMVDEGQHLEYSSSTGDDILRAWRVNAL
ncbi:hypothetical protein IEI94_13660 [Halomonas sp. ML-15]|uniref:hypothetical protein n=1 Tax=Halomonas sp. ML-15 TaxID=2773305 RepID=UPI0017475B75|nr:hypothetical protein [Halomonas sp. ML-15]MBD3896900.1 hypothetical protein [Halomonas sp. ML-15]